MREGLVVTVSPDVNKSRDCANQSPFSCYYMIRLWSIIAKHVFSDFFPFLVFFGPLFLHLGNRRIDDGLLSDGSLPLVFATIPPSHIPTPKPSPTVASRLDRPGWSK